MLEPVSNDLLGSLVRDENWWCNRHDYAILTNGLLDIIDEIVSRTEAPLRSPEAVIHKNAVLSERVVVKAGAKIGDGVVIDGPAIIGEQATLGPNCHIKAGAYIGKGCVVGPGAEIKASVLMDGVKMYHFGYIGNSIVGRNVNIGAGFVTAVKRLDGKPVSFSFDGLTKSFGRKAGCLIGDNTQVAVSSTIMPGAQIPPDSILYPRNGVSHEDKTDQSNFGILASDTAWLKLIELWTAETDRYWSRNNVFLLINGGLIAILTTQNSSDTVAFLVSLVAVFICTIWYRVNAIGKYYLDRWKGPIKAVEKEWPIKPITDVSLSSSTDDTPKKYRSSSKYMQLIVRGAVISWGLLAIILGWRLAGSTLTSWAAIFWSWLEGFF